MSNAPDGPTRAKAFHSACSAEELRYKLSHIIDAELSREARQEVEGKTVAEAELIYAVSDCQSIVAWQNLSLMDEGVLAAIHAATEHPKYRLSEVVLGALGEVFDPKSAEYLRDFSLFHGLFNDAGIHDGEFHQYLYLMGQLTSNWDMVALRSEPDDFLRMLIRIITRTRTTGDIHDGLSQELLDMVRDDPALGEHVIKLTTDRGMKLHSISPEQLMEIESHPVPALRDGIL